MLKEAISDNMNNVIWSQYGEVLRLTDGNINNVNKLSNIILRGNYKTVYRLFVLNPDETISYEIPQKDIILNSSGYSENYQNGQRRSLNINLVNIDRKYTPSINSIWVNNRFRFDVGIKYEEEIYWFSRGIYILGNPDVTHAGSDKQVSLNLVDKFGVLDGKQGTLETTYEIPVDSDIEEAIIGILTLDNGSGYPIDLKPIIYDKNFKGKKMPYTLSKDAGSTLGEMILEIATILNAECYYNSQGNLCFYSINETTLDLQKPTLYNYSQEKIGYFGGSVTNAFEDIVNEIHIVGDNIDNEIFSAVAKNENPASSLCIQRIGRRVSYINDTNIYSDDLALQRAAYELRKVSIINTTININVAFNPLLFVNNLISVYDKEFSFNNDKFLIQSISYNIGNENTMSISCSNIVNFEKNALYLSNINPTEVKIPTYFNTSKKDNSNVTSAIIEFYNKKNNNWSKYNELFINFNNDVTLINSQLNEINYKIGCNKIKINLITDEEYIYGAFLHLQDNKGFFCDNYSADIVDFRNNSKIFETNPFLITKEVEKIQLDLTIGVSIFNLDNFVSNNQSSYIKDSNNSLSITSAGNKTWSSATFRIDNLKPNTDYNMKFDVENTNSNSNLNMVTVYDTDNKEIFKSDFYNDFIFNTMQSSSVLFKFNATKDTALDNTATYHNIILRENKYYDEYLEHKSSVLSSEKNYINVNDIVYNFNCSFEKKDYNQVTITTNGTKTWSHVLVEVSVTPNTQYYFSTEFMNSNPNLLQNHVIIYESNKTSRLFTIDMTKDNKSFSFNSKNNDTVYVALHASRDIAIDNTTIYSSLMILRDDALDKSYVPTVENNVEINNALSLCSGGDLSDEISVIDRRTILSKRFKTIELTGEEEWNFNNNIGGYFQYYIKDKDSNPNGVCSHFKYSTTGYVEGNKFYISTIGNIVFMHPIYQGQDIEGLDNWKQFLRDMKSNGNSVILQYEVKEPEISDIGILHNYRTYNGTTNINFISDIKPEYTVVYNQEEFGFESIKDDTTKLNNGDIDNFQLFDADNDLGTLKSIKGKTEQYSTKGYNLLNEVLTNKSDGTYWVTDKVDGVDIQANKDYYFTTYTSMSVIRVLEVGTDKVIKEVTDTINLIFNVESATKVYFTIYKAEGIPTDTKILLAEGNTQKPYEPFTGGKPSPSPDYPQEIQNVTYYENLFNINDKLSSFTNTDDGWITLSYDNSQGDSVRYVNFFTKPSTKILPDTEYTIVTEVSYVSDDKPNLYPCSMTGSQSQMSVDYQISRDLIKSNCKYVRTVKSVSNLQDSRIVSMLRGFISIAAGQNVKVTFRVSVFEGKKIKPYVKQDNYILTVQSNNNNILDLPENTFTGKGITVVSDGRGRMFIKGSTGQDFARVIVPTIANIKGDYTIYLNNNKAYSDLMRFRIVDDKSFPTVIGFEKENNIANITLSDGRIQYVDIFVPANSTVDCIIKPVLSYQNKSAYCIGE